MEESGVPGGNHRPTASNWWNFWVVAFVGYIYTVGGRRISCNYWDPILDTTRAGILGCPLELWGILHRSRDVYPQTGGPSGVWGGGGGRIRHRRVKSWNQSAWKFRFPPIQCRWYVIESATGHLRLSEWWFNAVSATEAIFTARAPQTVRYMIWLWY